MTACVKSWTYSGDNPSDPSDIRAETFRHTSERLPNSEGLVSQNWLLEVAASLLADGITLRLDPPDRLKLTGDAAAVAKWAPILRPHKPALLRLLTERQEAVAEATSERAAICEHDGGLPRAEADALADLAGRFYRHHWSCASCRAGTQVGAGLHRPCPEGALLWTAYAEAAADARGTKKSWSKQ